MVGGVGCDGLFCWSVTGAVQVYSLTCHNHQAVLYVQYTAPYRPYKPDKLKLNIYLPKGFRIQNFIFASGLKDSCRNKILEET